MPFLNHTSLKLPARMDIKNLTHRTYLSPSRYDTSENKGKNQEIEARYDKD